MSGSLLLIEAILILIEMASGINLRPFLFSLIQDPFTSLSFIF